MILFTAAAPPFMKNGFVLGCERTRDAVVIDPGDEVGDLLGFIGVERLAPVAILLTHAHVDHVSGVGRAKDALEVPVWLHRDDQPLYERAAEQAMLFGLRMEAPPPVDHFYAGNGPWGRFGDYEVAVHHTPGHCPGGVCLEVNRVAEPIQLEGLFVGDTLFAGSIGRTDLPGGDYATLMRSITQVLLGFPDAAVVHSGHGPDTTIGHERATNPFVLEWLDS
ncbi:MAG: MBL fold metallo-hydrolase [Acidobacteriota bacterium]|nr:MBL fold metallo-hydrolase [Acidobacteriota bacterium]